MGRRSDSTEPHELTGIKAGNQEPVAKRLTVRLVCKPGFRLYMMVPVAGDTFMSEVDRGGENGEKQSSVAETAIMESLSIIAKEQYRYVRDARAVLLRYCRTLAVADFIKEHPSFGKGGSVRNLLVHSANTYAFWIGRWALGQNVGFTPYDAVQSIDDVIPLYDAIDAMMFTFMDGLQQAETSIIEYEINGQKNATKPFRLFSHVITHEFHHKGQILSLSRHWGYTPVDTDIMR